MGTSDIQTILKAAAFAAHKHRDQRRKDAAASPYINHPIALANILANEGGITDATVIVAALLHDTVEDTETTPAELRELFGEEVAKVVMEVTDDKSLPKAQRKRLQVEHAAHISKPAKLVKLADKISNLRDIAASAPREWDPAEAAGVLRLGKAGRRRTRGRFAAAAAGIQRRLPAKTVIENLLMRRLNTGRGRTRRRGSVSHAPLV